MSVIKHVTQLQHNNEQMLDIPVHIRKVSWFSYPSWKHIGVTLSWYKTLDGAESALSQASQQHKGSTSLRESKMYDTWIPDTEILKECKIILWLSAVKLFFPVVTHWLNN